MMLEILLSAKLLLLACPQEPVPSVLDLHPDAVRQVLAEGTWEEQVRLARALGLEEPLEELYWHDEPQVLADDTRLSGAHGFGPFHVFFLGEDGLGARYFTVTLVHRNGSWEILDRRFLVSHWFEPGVSFQALPGGPALIGFHRRAGYGTGTSAGSGEWFLVGEEGLTPALEATTWGFASGWGRIASVETVDSGFDLRREGEQTSFRMEWTLSFSNQIGVGLEWGEPMFRTTLGASWLWDEEAGAFRFQPEGELRVVEDLAAVPFASGSDWVRLCFPQLVEWIRGHGADGRTWLAAVAERLRDTELVERLAAAAGVNEDPDWRPGEAPHPAGPWRSGRARGGVGPGDGAGNASTDEPRAPAGWEVLGTAVGWGGWTRRARDPATGVTFRLIEPGRFRMGSEEDEVGRGDDESLREVELRRAFYLAETELTQAQWERVMGPSDCWSNGFDHPVERVSWEDAQTYCERAGAGYRLPTEAEWEYACRAGTSTAYSFGEELLPAEAVFEGNRPTAVTGLGAGSPGAAPVGQRPANPWGLHDMHGNVAEWCWDWYRAEGPSGEARPDPAGPIRGEGRVIRGGSWSSGPGRLRSAARARQPADWSSPAIGFRVAWSLG